MTLLLIVPRGLTNCWLSNILKLVHVLKADAKLPEEILTTSTGEMGLSLNLQNRVFEIIGSLAMDCKGLSIAKL